LGVLQYDGFKSWGEIRVVSGNGGDGDARSGSDSLSMDSLLRTEIGRLAHDLRLERSQIEAAIELLLSGASVSQVFRYRKMQTGAVSEDALRAIARRLHHVKHILERRDHVKKLAEARGVWNDATAKAVEEAGALDRLNDLATSLRPRKASFAQEARDKGLEALADAIFEQSETVGDLQETLAGVVDPDKGLATVDDVKAGLASIVAERMYEHADARSWGREVMRAGRLTTTSNPNVANAAPPDAANPPPPHPARRQPTANDYRAFARFSEPIESLGDGRVLAINRGERQGFLTASFDYDKATFEGAVRHAVGMDNHRYLPVMEAALPLALERLAAELTDQLREEMTDRAEEQAAGLAARAVHKILMQRGLPNERVLAIDPGVKNGCRYAVLEVGGAILDCGVVYPFAAKRKRKKKKKSRSLVPEPTMQQQAEVWLQKLEAESVEGAASAEGSVAGSSEDAPVRIESPKPATEAAEEGKPVLPADSFYRSTPESGEGTEPTLEPATEPAEIGPGPSLHGMRVDPPAAPTPPNPEIAPDAPHAAATSGEAEADEEDSDEGDDGEDEETEAAAPGEPRIPLPPRRDRAKKLFADIAAKFNVNTLALGNGPAARDVEELLAEVVAEHAPHLQYALVGEAAAAAYSSSVVAREELPELDAGIRCAVSLGRRLQDPLRELVKVDPQNLGLGTAHHDIGGKRLRDRLLEAVESCVNEVGVDLNAAHPWLLQHVSGLNATRARLICEYRAEHGPFKNRAQLTSLEYIGEDVFNQCAGFLRVMGGDEPLDETFIHPESYDLARRLLARFQATTDQLRDASAWPSVAAKLDAADAEALAKELEADVPTVWDLLEYLARPHRDPRDGSPAPVLKKGLRKLEDLKEGQEIVGPVVNVVDFGAFVDIGLKESGLVHLSQLATRFVRSPHDVVSVGDVVTVWVIGVDHERKRVSLTMLPPQARQRPPAGEGRRRGPPGERRGDGVEAGGQGGFQRRPRGDRPPQDGGQRFGGGRGRDQRGGERRGGGPPKPREYNVQAKPKPKPELSKEALEGKGVLHGFGELKAFFEAQKKKPDDLPSAPPPGNPETPAE
jgi:uncharacterized protein